MVLCFLSSKAVENIRQASAGMASVFLEGLFWLSRLWEPKHGHLPKHIVQSVQRALTCPRDIPLWFYALQQSKTHGSNRQRIIEYNNMLAEEMLQRQTYLGEPHDDGIFPGCDIRSAAHIPNIPHRPYQKPEETLPLASEVHTDSLEPWSSITAITPTYVSSYEGKYLSGLSLQTPDSDRVLGH